MSSIKHKSWMSAPFKNKANKKEQLCWSCVKCCGRCSWSKNLTPVVGWNAIPVTLRGNTARDDVDTYMIIDCPEYEEGFNLNIDDDDFTPFERLGNAVVLSAAKEYKEALLKLKTDKSNRGAMRSKRELEQFFKSEDFMLYSDLDGELIIHKLNEMMR